MTDDARPVPVLFVAVRAVAGGAERSLAALVRGLPERGYRPHVALGEEGPLEDWLREAGCPTTRVRIGRLRNPVDVARTRADLVRLGRRTEARLLVANGSPDQIYAGLAARRLRVPSVWWQKIVPGVDFGGPRMSRPVIDRAAARVPVSVVIANSDATASAQRALTPRTPVTVVHTGVDLEAIRAQAGSGLERRRELGIDGPLVVLVGWVWPWKGQDVFLRAARAVADVHPDARFVVVGGTGDAVFRGELDKLVTELDLTAGVTFTGERSDPWSWFDAADVVVHASWGEAFGQVVLEAMALGKPVVATSAGGPAELIEDGRTGSLVPPGDHAAMAAAVLAYLDESERRARVGAAAAAASRSFSQERMIDGIVEVLDGLIGPARSSG